ncbi:hypothetical protein K1719_042060 [Acacia pycnantha]|nr:hypothetical protein K1719_042060 [Acacia pycnantha]
MESNAGSSSEMNSNQACNACQIALADLNILKMNVSLLNSQCNSSIQSLLSSIAHLNQQVETLFRRIEKLEGNGKINVSTTDSAIQTDLELSPLNESYTQIGSSTQTQTRNGSSTEENVSGPTAQTLQTITPFNEIIKTQMQEEARRKEKGKIVEASTSIPRITRKITPEKFYPPISLIRLGTTKKPIETEAEIKEDIEEDQEFQNKMSNIRAQNYHIIFQEMTRAIKSEKQWVYYCGMTSIITAFGKTSHDQPLFVQWCKNCEEREKAMQDIEDPETDLSVL